MGETEEGGTHKVSYLRPWSWSMGLETTDGQTRSVYFPFWVPLCSWMVLLWSWACTPILLSSPCQEGMRDWWSRVSPTPSSCISATPSILQIHRQDASAYFCAALRFWACVLHSIIMTVVDYTRDKCRKIGNLINCNSIAIDQSHYY